MYGSGGPDLSVFGNVGDVGPAGFCLALVEPLDVPFAITAYWRLCVEWEVVSQKKSKHVLLRKARQSLMSTAFFNPSFLRVSSTACHIMRVITVSFSYGS